MNLRISDIRFIPTLFQSSSICPAAHYTQWLLMADPPNTDILIPKAFHSLSISIHKKNTYNCKQLFFQVVQNTNYYFSENLNGNKLYS